MSNNFDPFDERHRNKVKRRRSDEVAYDNRCWQERIDKHFARAIAHYNSPMYIESAAIYHYFMYYDSEGNLDASQLKRHMKTSLERLGYTKMTNENTKDGRWKTDFGNSFVYSKCGAPKIGRLELKQALAG